MNDTKSKCFKNIIHEYVQTHREDIISDLKEFLKIPSVRGDAKEGAPFGVECAGALEHARQLYEREGFFAEVNQEGGYLLSYFGEGETTVGIFAHADVVPAGEGWTLTTPFNPVEKDGFLIGRGALDDKSGVIASLYCAKMLKECGIPFKGRLLCFAGVNEESGMQDIRNYISEHKKPEFSIVPDTAFPLYRGNKGKVAFDAESVLKLSDGISISGGTGASVIGEATAVLPFDECLRKEISERCGVGVEAECNGDAVVVRAKGIAKHSALPEGGLSAACLLADVLRNCESLSDSDRAVFDGVYNMSSCNYGEFFGIECEDNEFGKLTCVLTKISTGNDGNLILKFNIRYNSRISKEAILESVNRNAGDLIRIVPETLAYSMAQSLPADNVYVKRLLDVYNDFSGRKNGVSYVNAGGTYRQYLENAVEIGTTNIWGRPEGLPDGHGGVHQPDECININGFLEAIELTALMLLECDELGR